MNEFIHLFLGKNIVQVYAAVEQSVQRAPQHVEVLTLRGLICESRGSLSVAIKCFQLVQFLFQETHRENESILVDKSSMISLNLARVLCKVDLLTYIHSSKQTCRPHSMCM